MLIRPESHERLSTFLSSAVDEQLSALEKENEGLEAKIEKRKVRAERQTSS